jgi:hypothetical protein
VLALREVVRDREIDIEATRDQLGFRVRDRLTTGLDGGSAADPLLKTKDEAADWLADLARRLRSNLPTP